MSFAKLELKWVDSLESALDLKTVARKGKVLDWKMAAEMEQQLAA
jgi:hypothetical protein